MDGWLIFDEPASGSWNMAVDEALLAWSAETGQWALRFYEWSEPTVSLGYFQAASERQQHPTSLECAWVRRSTGGGAIVHDRELTYSVAMPVADRTSRDVRWLYDLMHESLIAELGARGVTARLCETERAAAGSEAAPFLCFQRRSSGDVLLGDHKIAGSAQRRQPGAVLQHGSVLLESSPAARELRGIGDLGNVCIERQELADSWGNRVLGRLGGSFRRQRALPDPLAVGARLLQQAKYDTAAWNSKR